MSGNYSFVIVGKDDNPLYELDLGSFVKKDCPPHLSHFILHSSLDIVEELVWKNTALYLKTVDKFGDLYVSSYVTNGHIKFLMLHDVKNEDGIKTFFNEVHELYIKVLLNPFYEHNTPITFPNFDAKVRLLGKRLKSN